MRVVVSAASDAAGIPSDRLVLFAELILPARATTLAMIVIAEPHATLGAHQEKGWRPHQPATLRQGGIHGQWDVAVSTANVAERRQPSLRLEGSMTAPISNHDGLITRRSILVGAGSLLCAPAIVRAASLMPVRRPPPPFGPQYAGFWERLLYHSLDSDLRAGRMSTVLNGEIIPEADARRMVAHAQDYGWLPPYISIYGND
jgi:hypothetical protein